MKLITSIELTKEERIALAMASKVLYELERMLPNGNDLRETIEEACDGLTHAIKELADMGNDFSVLP